MLKLLLVFLGAGLGGSARYLIGLAFHTFAPSAFPWPTLLINVTGCFAIGLLVTLFDGPVPVREDLRLALTVGLLGGYTTFSSFGKETMTLVLDHKWAMACLYVLLSNAMGLAAVFAGAALATRAFPARPA